MISLNYCETLSAAAGWSMETAREQTMEAGPFILIYEGAVLEGWDGNALRVAGETGASTLLATAGSENCAAVVALGSCAVNGGWMGANPNSSDALGVKQFLNKNGVETPVINIPGCPANPEWVEAVLVNVLMLGSVPALDDNFTPVGMFDSFVHDNCERRGHFENGEFVYAFGTEEEAKNYCLYPMGCRGPQTKSNCSIVRWNHRRSWCVASGAPCIGCCTAQWNDPGHNWVEVNTPFRARFRDLRIGGLHIQPEFIGFGLAGLVAAALVVHGFGMKISGRTDGGADFEEIREWDAKHPDQALGQYDEDVLKGGKN
jgi:hydrogenase small subunit